MTSVLYKTKMCNYKLAGNCRHGTSCLHAHSQDELRSKPDFQKTKLCRRFQKGHCLDTECSHAHGEQEVKRSDQFYKQKLCKYFLEDGSCIRGRGCYFAHSEAELRKKNPATGVLKQSPTKDPAAKFPPPPPPLAARVIDSNASTATSDSRHRFYSYLNKKMGAKVDTEPEQPQRQPQRQQKQTLMENGVSSTAIPMMQRRQLSHNEWQTCKMTSKSLHPPTPIPAPPALSKSGSPWSQYLATSGSTETPSLSLSGSEFSEPPNPPCIQIDSSEWTPSQIAEALLSQSLFSASAPNALFGNHQQDSPAALRRLEELETQKCEWQKGRNFQTEGYKNLQQQRDRPLGPDPYLNSSDLFSSCEPNLGVPYLAQAAGGRVGQSLTHGSLFNTAAGSVIPSVVEANQAKEFCAVELFNQLVDNLLAMAIDPRHNDQCCNRGNCSSALSVLNHL